MFHYQSTRKDIPLTLIKTAELKNWLTAASKFQRNWVKQNSFQAKSTEICFLPTENGEIAQVLVGSENNIETLWSIAHLPKKLPEGDYYLAGNWSKKEITLLSIGWGLGFYTFNQFKTCKKPLKTSLYLSKNKKRALAFIEAISLVRDLINTPANEMMPEHLAKITKTLAQEFGATFSQLIGKELLAHNYPTIHAVGRASQHQPRLLTLQWGKATDPEIVLVGKGVCFDTGGLDLKPSKFMRTMKKDMGGAAHVLGLAHLVMALNLPFRLRVLIPAVDNAISGNAFRPGDIIKTRLGKTVEVDNTDAEGRLILCDALAKASEKKPALIIDFATLTGAARVALGTEVPVYFANTKKLAKKLNQASQSTEEMIWQLPLYQPYFEQLKSQNADLLNCSPQGYGGAMTAALFLNEFVDKKIPWVHFDVMAWNTRNRTGRPLGGEAMGLLAVFDYLENY